MAAIKNNAAHVDRKLPDWTFLTNHGHVLVVLATNPDALMRDVAITVGITERAVQKIVADLEADGYVVRERDGRRNHYRVGTKGRLRHPIEGHVSVGALMKIMTPK